MIKFNMNTSLQSVIESILFVHGDPIRASRIAELAGHTEEEVKTVLAALGEGYKDKGFLLMEKDGAYQLGSNPNNSSYIEKLAKGEFSEELSRAALETLAVIAYKGPIGRSDIDYVRGVNSSFTIRNLLMRGLIERVEDPRDARMWRYRVTFDFLKHLGIAKMEDLPQYEELNKKAVEMTEAMQQKAKAADHATD